MCLRDLVGGNHIVSILINPTSISSCSSCSSLHRPGVTQRGHPRRALSCYWISALPKSRGLCPFLLKCFQNNAGAQFWIETPEVVLAYSSALFHKQLRELSPPSLSPFMFLLQICARLSTYCCCLLNWIRLLA